MGWLSLTMTISVVVPTYRRPEDLDRCLAGLRRQERPADEVLVVMQGDDSESARIVEKHADWKALKSVLCTRGGAVNQYNAGLDASRGELVAITDDDAIPRTEWLMRIEQHFLADSGLGGVGGRDYVQENGTMVQGAARVIGTVQWFGRIVGNHHVGTRLNRSVDILKGVNMSFRRDAVGASKFDTNLRGSGAQTCCDMAFSFSVQRSGWRLLYDPQVAVDHFPAPRFDPDQRKAPSLSAIEDNCFNYYYTLRRHMKEGPRRSMALAWASLVGGKQVPGVLRGIGSYFRRDKNRIEVRRAAKRAWDAAKAMALTP